MSALRLPLRLCFLASALALTSCGDDDASDSGGSTSGSGGSAGADASGVVGVLSGLDGGDNTHGLADAGRDHDGAVPPAGDGGTNTPDGGGPTCGDGRLDGSEICDPGLDPCCKRTCDGPIAKGHVCRAAAGDCDAPESCDGHKVACPPDELVDEGEECRPAEGDCDVAEGCDGEGADCPSDELVDEGEECRPAEGDCDVAEQCTGDDADCPSDRPAASSVSCRAAADSCDAAEMCTGSSTVCPPDLPVHCAVQVLGGALPITVTGTTVGTCATYVPTCLRDGANANERVYVFTPPTTGTYRFDTVGSAFDTAIALRSGTSCGAAELGCADDTPDFGRVSVLESSLTAGQTVLVMVDGYDGAAGPFTLRVRNAADYAGWTCPAARFGTGDGCDCGCGAVDADCSDATLDSCERCTACHEGVCAGTVKVNATDTTECTGWLCPNDWYATDDGCDCGCGIVDPDCESADPAGCEFCSACGDPTVTCPNSASIEATDNSRCTTAWTCDADYYGVGDGCDCGCGIIDPDCAGATHQSCYYCEACGDMEADCAGSASVDPNTNALCAATPTWTCDPEWQGMGDGCDCGCGTLDPDCASADASECEYCFACREYAIPCPNSARVVATDNTRCL